MVSISIAVASVLLSLLPRYPHCAGRRRIGVRDARTQSECGEAQGASDCGSGHDFLQIHVQPLCNSSYCNGS